MAKSPKASPAESGRFVTRHELGREAFTAKVWEWKEAYGARITKQLRRLGCSLDWSREVFTMDAPRAKSVTAAFLEFHKKGLVYRDVRLTNWCDESPTRTLYHLASHPRLASRDHSRPPCITLHHPASPYPTPTPPYP